VKREHEEMKESISVILTQNDIIVRHEKWFHNSEQFQDA